MLTPRRLVPIVLAPWLLAGCLGLECTEIGCAESFRWSAVIPHELTYPDIRALEVRACRNDECVEGSLSALDPAEPAPGSGVGIALAAPAPDPARLAVLTVFHDLDGSARVELTWSVPDPTDGDRYLVEVSDATGAVVIGLSERPVEYTVLYPNGPECGPECRTISLEGSTLGAMP